MRTLDQALKTARLLLDLGHSLDVILASDLIAPVFRDTVREAIGKEVGNSAASARLVVADPNRPDWLGSENRSTWYYWPTLRRYLLSQKGWSISALNSLDDASDRILGQISSPYVEQFDVRGLVLGFVQSGKTANYTALIAKAVDAGYRLVVVLAGIDNGLRMQTNIRLKKELVGFVDGRPGAVPLPPQGKQWHEFTKDELRGDFRPGFANHAALQGSQPVLLVIKKNGRVLRRLLEWLDSAPSETRNSLPFLLIDDEADQASVDTRGSRVLEDEDPLPEDYEPPSVINGLIRQLLNRFRRSAYVAYTATPFANILIPHNTVDPSVGEDLYPRDFIVDLPKPPGYFGAEDFFGRRDAFSGEYIDGIDVVRGVADSDVLVLQNGELPESLVDALTAFVLAGAARAYRQGHSNDAATMLIHTSQRVLVQSDLTRKVKARFEELRNEWRYQRGLGIRDRLYKQWQDEFSSLTDARYPERSASFEDIEDFITLFFDAQVFEINSATGSVLDYEREPGLKAIAIGGNRLSRGLTLEGLLVSYFVRRSATYDTLMQMGRWFGYRGGYEDLTRIYTTSELEEWFSDLAFVEHTLREDIQVYENMGLTPRQVGLRIWQHPTMQVTAQLKRRFSNSTTISMTYALSLEQTFKFPLREPERLSVLSEQNRLSVIQMLAQIGAAHARDGRGPIWTGISHDVILAFLSSFRVDDQARSISLELIIAYIQRCISSGELTEWTVAVRGRESHDSRLGSTDWGIVGGEVNQISRSRIGETDSLGVITSPEDEVVGLPEVLVDAAKEMVAQAALKNEAISLGRAAREVRPSSNGVLLIYPISRNSGVDSPLSGGRRPIYENPDAPSARDLVGIALSFPKSNRNERVEGFLEGTLPWRRVD